MQRSNQFPVVTLVLITGDEVLMQCFQSILDQDYRSERMHLVVNHQPPQKFSNSDCVNKYENCSRNREVARHRALATDSDYFLFLDDDIVLPKDAVSVFVKMAAEKTFNVPESMERIHPGIRRSVGKEVLGGYYPILNTNRYVCGRWVADNTFLNFTNVQAGLRKTDLVGLGCAFISRRVLESVPFEAGTNLFCHDATTGREMIVGECGVFGNRLAELGVPMFMCGEVVCQHLIRPKAGEVKISAAELAAG